MKEIKTFLSSYGIRLPEEFDSKIANEAERFNGGRLPGIPAIENLLRCCEYWKEYCVTREDFEKLVCQQCYKMARIQCSVINTHMDSPGFVGKQCGVQEELLPECTTTVASAARCSLFKGMGAAEKVFSPLH